MTTHAPVNYGFADNGDSWRSFGEAQGLIAFLETKSNELRDWVALAAFAREITPQDHVLPPLSEIYPIQNYVNEGAVEAYRNGMEPHDSSDEWYELHPTLMRINGQIFIFQGTHRLAALSANGESSYFGWFLDLDSPENS